MDELNGSNGNSEPSGHNGHRDSDSSTKRISVNGPLIVVSETRCPGCRKLLMRGDEIKCPRCKEVVKIDSPILHHPVVVALMEELSELKSRLGLVH